MYAVNETGVYCPQQSLQLKLFESLLGDGPHKFNAVELGVVRHVEHKLDFECPRDILDLVRHVDPAVVEQNSHGSPACYIMKPHEEVCEARSVESLGSDLVVYQAFCDRHSCDYRLCWLCTYERSLRDAHVSVGPRCCLECPLRKHTFVHHHNQLFSVQS